MKKTIMLFLGCFISLVSIAQDTTTISECDFLSRRFDKFKDSYTFSSPSDDHIQFIKVIADKQDAIIFMRLVIVNDYIHQIFEKGVILLLSDGSKIKWDEEKVETTASGTQYEYRAFIRLEKPQLERLTQYYITDYRLYIYDKSLAEKEQIRFKEYLKCVIKAK